MERVSPREFINNVLSGIAIAIVAGLIPNAILGELFKALVTLFNFSDLVICHTRDSIYCATIDRRIDRV